MQKELFETGKSVDAAIDSACEKLGCSREDCEWEIIDLPKKGFLGLKNIPAKVRVSVEIPDEKPVKTVRPPQPENKARTQQTVKPQTPSKPAQQGQRRERPEASPRPRAEKRNEPINPGEISEKETLAKDYLAEVFEAAGLKAEYVITHEHGGSCINIVGEGLGMIIGRRGETLDAIQYLAGLVANRGEGEYLRLTVDCGDYRLRRKGTLESLAKKLANQVLKTNISKTLEPMNPFERRIIHATVSEIEGVSSSSVGEEPNRRVVITSPNAKPASRSGYGRDRGPRRDFRPREGGAENGDRSSEKNERSERGDRGGYGRDRDRRDSRRGGERRDGGGRSSQSQPTPQGPPKQTPESETTSGISFGKIDL